MKKELTTMVLAMTIIFGGINLANAVEQNNALNNEPQKIQKMKHFHEDAKIKHEQKKQEFILKLGLTDEQIQKVDQLKASSKEKIKPLMEKEKAKFNEIREIRANDDINIKNQDKKIEAIQKELKTINQEIRQIKQDEKKAFKAILTDEQLKKLEQMKAEAKKFKGPHNKACPKFKNPQNEPQKPFN